MRKSSVRDLAKDISPETQEREVRALAARHGDDGDALVMLSDWDVSGRAQYTKKRAGYLRLIAAIEAGECSVVYSYSLSRLGRSSAELAKLFDLCKARGVRIRLVVDNVDTSTASGRMMAGVLADIAQFEAEVASERLLAMYETKRARAKEQGIDPRDAVRTSRRYGEVRVNGEGETKGEGESGDAVLAAFRETGSFSKAARLLNERGVKPRDADAWWASSVGVVVSRLDPEVGARRRTRGARPASATFALARLLRCGTCGHMLTGSSLPDGKGGKRVRYACRFAESSPHPRVTISEHLVMPAVEEEAALYRDPDEFAAPDARVARSDELKARRQRVVESRLDGLLDRGEAARQAAEIDAELNRLAEPRRPDLRLAAGLTPREVNDVFRSLWDHIDLDPATFQPVSFTWREPSTRAGD